jgi:hypothetical protein
MVTSQSNVPWSGAIPYIKTGLQGAQSLYQSGAGFKAPNFQTYVPFSAQTTQALNMTQDIANQGNPLAGSSMATVGGMLAGGAQDKKYNQLYQQAGNPYFDQAVQNQADQTAADVQRQFGGLGRIGSAADTGALVSQIGNMRTQAMANNWNQNIANQRGILSDQSGNQLNAVGAAPGAYEQQYLPAQHLGQVGAAYEDLAQRQLQSRVDKFNTNQQSGWNRLNAYNSAVSGTNATQPGFASVQHPNNFFGGVLGGALGGASMFPTNPLAGAIGGGLLGGAANSGLFNGL